jgi:hypothetical protein
LAVFIGVDLFNEKITFTDNTPEKEELVPTNEKNVDKGVDTNIDLDTETNTETDNKAEAKISIAEEDTVSEAVKQARNPENYKNKNLSVKEKMDMMLKSMMAHDKNVYTLFEEESKLGTPDLVPHSKMVNTMIENSINDTKAMMGLSKSVDDMTMEDRDLEKKRSLNEENDKTSSVSKKFKDSDLND